MDHITILHDARGERHFTQTLGQSFGECDGCAAKDNAMLCEALPACREATVYLEVTAGAANAPDAVEAKAAA